jgi:hypothetical protein
MAGPHALPCRAWLRPARGRVSRPAGGKPAGPAGRHLPRRDAQAPEAQGGGRAPWRLLPPEFGKADSIARCYRCWTRTGLWMRLLRAMHRFMGARSRIPGAWEPV